MNAQEIIEAWDRGDTIWSIEMGGLGPGYEQAIQTAAVEMLREGIDVPLEGPEADHYKVIWEDVCNRAIQKHDESLGGITGAMYGAAKNLSWHWLHGMGQDKLLDAVEPDRKIQVSKNFPQATTSKGGAA